LCTPPAALPGSRPNPRKRTSPPRSIRAHQLAPLATSPHQLAALAASRHQLATRPAQAVRNLRQRNTSRCAPRASGGPRSGPHGSFLQEHNTQ